MKHLNQIYISGLKEKGLDVSLPALSRDIEARDRRDSERSAAPLRPAADARDLGVL